MSADQHPSERLASIDILRGLTMALMIFVNELSGVSNLPWWNFHAPADVNVMTYVDMVFPTFLFVVGLSLPLAIRNRLQHNPSHLSLWGHVLQRTASLMVLGLILANADQADPHRMLLPPPVWALLGILGCALFLNQYPATGALGISARAWRSLGLVLVAIDFALFRHSQGPDQPSWIDPGYPEILGLIGYTYFAVCLLYIPTRRWRWSAPAAFLLMAGLNIGMAAHWIHLPQGFDYWIWPFNNGAMAAIVLAGVLVATIFQSSPGHSPLRRTLAALAFAALTFLAGWALRPLGISKIRATPTWALLSISAATLAFVALYWLCDRWRRTGWAFWVRSAGSNTLTTYLLPDVWEYLLLALGISYLDRHFNSGLIGVLRCLLFTAFILAISATLTRLRLRLRL